MRPPRLNKSKSLQLIKYVYRYALEKYTTQHIEAMIPYGDIGMILWEVGHQIYAVMMAANDEDRNQILSFVQQSSPQEIQEDASEMSEDPGFINAMSLPKESRAQVILGIYQTLKAMPNQRLSSTQIAHQINQSLFQGDPVISVQAQIDTHQSLGPSVVHSILNGGVRHAIAVNVAHELPKIDRFEILGLLGQGSYAKVYLAKDLSLSQTCALKVGVVENRMRFDREVEFMKTINHPNVLSCLDADVFQNEKGILMYWIAMPNMGGLTLADLITTTRLDLQTKLLIFHQLISGLAALHEKGIIHRDLKPSNCLISQDFQLKITDFGLSKYMNCQVQASQVQASQVQASQVQASQVQASQVQDVIGTPAYMSPEQIVADSRQISFATDVWAFGMIAYEMIVSDLPWGRHLNAFQLTGNILHLEIDYKKLSVLGLPQIQSVIQKCLQRNQQLRYASAVDLKDVLLPLINEPQTNQPQSAQSQQEERKKSYQRVWGSSLFFMIGFWIFKWISTQNEQVLSEKIKVAQSHIEWVKIKGGTFQMGSNDPKGDDDEKPIHTVNIADFDISKSEITVKQYRKCIEAKVCTLPKSKADDPTCNWGDPDRDDFPINCVDWYQARTFARWVGGELPSESQWEYAARSQGKPQPYPWGTSMASCTYAVMFEGQDGCGLLRSWPVCSKPKGHTEQGVCDMAGNVWEWILDERHSHYEGAPTDGSAWCKRKDCSDVEGKSHQRLHRGGGWKKFPDMRVSNRPFYPPQPIDYSFIGIRVIKSPSN